MPRRARRITRGRPWRDFVARDPVTGRWRVMHDRWHTAIVDAAGTAGLPEGTRRCLAAVLLTNFYNSASMTG